MKILMIIVALSSAIQATENENRTPAQGLPQPVGVVQAQTALRPISNNAGSALYPIKANLSYVVKGIFAPYQLTPEQLFIADPSKYYALYVLPFNPL